MGIGDGYFDVPWRAVKLGQVLKKLVLLCLA